MSTMIKPRTKAELLNMIKNESYRYLSKDYWRQISNMCLEHMSKDEVADMLAIEFPIEKPKLITYCTHIPISGSLPVTVQAYSKKEALQKVIDSEYEVDNSMFSLQDCESNTDLLTEDDFDDFDVLEEEVNEVQ
mgnify:CR=1 FL=1